MSSVSATAVARQLPETTQTTRNKHHNRAPLSSLFSLSRWGRTVAAPGPHPRYAAAHGLGQHTRSSTASCRVVWGQPAGEWSSVQSGAEAVYAYVKKRGQTGAECSQLHIQRNSQSHKQSLSPLPPSWLLFQPHSTNTPQSHSFRAQPTPTHTHTLLSSTAESTSFLTAFSIVLMAEAS